ncbi:MAG TPA: radical SAM protein [Clostridiales bacterium]|nr:radical SAM protein [Clostridiales bacterium]
MTGKIGGIQHFSVGDGPGIRTTVFFQGCSLHCPWCHNPEYLSGEGVEMTVYEVLAVVLEDRLFYEESGGGVTLSGGEPLEQFEFCLALAKACHNARISVIIDSAGQAPAESYIKLLPYVDGFYIDLKGAEGEKAYQITGASPQKATALMKTLAEHGANVTARVPLVPHYTDTKESMIEMGQLLTKAGVRYVSLLPFHNLASGKYKNLHIPYAYEQAPSMTKSVAQTLADALTEAFPRCFSVEVGG